MKIFHLSDLHIGMRLYNRDMLEDQAYILDQIIEQAKNEKPDAIVIAGDIYDRSIPSAEAVDVFNSFVSKASKELPGTELMMISGNHDSASRINLYRDVLAPQKIHMIGEPPRKPEEHIEKVTIEDEHGPVNFWLLPFVRPSMVREITGLKEDGRSYSYSEAVKLLMDREEIDQNERNVLVSHQFYLPKGENPDEVERMDSEIRTLGNIDAVDAEVLESFDYAALGHIHKPMPLQKHEYRYSGTPIQMSVSEKGQQKYIPVVELNEKRNTEIRKLPLKPLREVRVLEGLLEDLLKQASDDYVVAVVTDPEDLDVVDMKDRLRAAFPHLLETRRSLPETLAAEEMELEKTKELSPLELCLSFAPDLDEESKGILEDVIREVMEEDA